jgi:hypothetical protein
LHSLFYHPIHHFNVAARGDFGKDTAKGGVQVYLAGNYIAQNARATFYYGRCCFVARGFDG